LNKTGKRGPQLGIDCRAQKNLEKKPNPERKIRGGTARKGLFRDLKKSGGRSSPERGGRKRRNAKRPGGGEV